MVHALEQAWQALCPGGILVDLRPLSLDSPLEVVAARRVERAGLVDMSADLPDDRAVDEAIEAAVRAKVFFPREVREFGFAYYWQSFDGMLKYTRERWDTAVFPADTLATAQVLQAQLGPNARFRIVLPMHLATYERPRLG
ncbi:MAG: hypothetical protein ACRDHG_00460 [Anaerolineales bacterium]